MGAINVVNQMRKFIVGDCLLIVLEYAPVRMRAENSEILRGSASKHRRQKAERQQGRALHDCKE